MFQVRTLDWKPPEPSRFDALMLTSAHAAVRAGPPLYLYEQLPCYCVGYATAAAARAAGLARIVTGPGDGAALLELMVAQSVRTALHLCGRDHLQLEHASVRLERQVVYASEAVPVLPEAAARALRSGAVALVHSQRAARLFAELTAGAGLDCSSIAVAAISPAAADELGSGWRSVSAAPEQTDQALLELAAKLCKTGG